MKVGISVICATCGRHKAPHGRSASPYRDYCLPENCEGYKAPPFVGCLWPGETSEEFGYAHCDYGTREAVITDECSICRRPVFEGKWHDHPCE